MSSPLDAQTLSLLRDVSRSFYLTLRILPPAIRGQLVTAYLLARTSDTIADTTVIPTAARLDALRQFRDRIAGKRAGVFTLDPFLAAAPDSAEKILLARAEQTAQALERFPVWDRERIQQVLSTIISGQLLDLERFQTAGAEKIVALRTAAELEDYIYRVAGCVGEFWTQLCCRHLYAPEEADEGVLTARGIEFGKGLQLINVLRDFPADLREGRCYLPAVELETAGVSPADLRHVDGRRRAQTVYQHWLKQAENYLSSGWEYTVSLPRRSMRTRLACAWPVLIGMKTLAKLARARDQVFQGERVKVSKAEVRRLLWQSVILYPFPRAWRGLFTPPMTPQGAREPGL